MICEDNAYQSDVYQPLNGQVHRGVVAALLPGSSDTELRVSL